MGDPYSFLESAISPPETLAIRNALKYLDHLNAVVVEETGASSTSGSSKNTGASATASFLTNPTTTAVRAKNPGATQGQGLGPKGALGSPSPDAAVVTRLKSQITPLGFHLAALPVRLTSCLDISSTISLNYHS